MNTPYELIANLITRFSTNNYLDVILYDIIGYTIADIIIVFFVLKIATFIRGNKTTSIIVCYTLLALTVAITPVFFFMVPDPYIFTILSAGISGIHYVIIIYTIFNMRGKISAIFDRIEMKTFNRESSSTDNLPSSRNTSRHQLSIGESHKNSYQQLMQPKNGIIVIVVLAFFFGLYQLNTGESYDAPTYQELRQHPNCCLDIKEVAKDTTDISNLPTLQKNKKERLVLDRNAKVAKINGKPAYYAKYVTHVNNSKIINITLTSDIVPAKNIDTFVDSLLYVTDENGTLLETNLIGEGFRRSDYRKFERLKEFQVHLSEENKSLILYVTSDNSHVRENESEVVEGVMFSGFNRANPSHSGWIDILIQ